MLLKCFVMTLHHPGTLFQPDSTVAKSGGNATGRQQRRPAVTSPKKCAQNAERQRNCSRIARLFNLPTLVLARLSTKMIRVRMM